MDIFKKLGQIDQRIIYVCLVLSLLIPLVKPLGLPVSIGANARKTFEAIDALEAGDTVIIDVAYSVSGAADVEPQAIAIVKHLFEKNVKVIFIATNTYGSMLTEGLLKPHEAEGIKIDGEDYVNMGYLSGGENALNLILTDIKKAYPADFRRSPTANMPILADIEGGKDIDMFLFFTTVGADMQVRQVSQYGIPLVAGLINTMAPQAQPYIDSGQINGMLVGLRGAAEYESLMKSPAGALAGMDAQSTGHLLILAFIFIGNLSYFMQKRATNKGGAQ